MSRSPTRRPISLLSRPTQETFPDFTFLSTVITGTFALSQASIPAEGPSSLTGFVIKISIP